MVSEEKIILMSKAAAYESDKYRDDSFAKRYYKEDYMDKTRLTLRIWATVYYIIYWGYTLVKQFYIEGVSLLHYDYGTLFVKVILYYAVILILVSWIGGFFAGIRYDSAKKRIDRYYELLASINDFNS
ncbi:MAG: hypothetical protein J6P72_02550 [Firmicutes bacterium]|nr:hypothetical protein [Bacillota bacterium]